MVERQAGVPTTDDRDWSALTLGERIRQIEMEGYLLIPDLLSAEQIAKIKSHVSTLETQGMDYSEHQGIAGDVMPLGGEIAETAAHPTTIGRYWVRTSSASKATTLTHSRDILVSLSIQTRIWTSHRP